MRWLIKLLISIPLAIIVILNVQLISQIKDMNSFYKISQREASVHVAGANNAINKHLLGQPERPTRRKTSSKSTSTLLSSSSRISNIESVIKAKTDENNNGKEAANLCKLKNLTIPQIKDCVAKLNENPVIRNRYYIEESLKKELLLQMPTTSSTTTSSTISTSTSTKSAAAVKNAEPAETIQNLQPHVIDLSTTPVPTTPGVYKMPEFLVIVIQIHSRLEYLRELVDSLRDVKHIEKSLVIFSHDAWDDEMNEFIRSIDFCAVISAFIIRFFQISNNLRFILFIQDCTNILSVFHTTLSE
jgi:hypothetical protein